MSETFSREDKELEAYALGYYHGRIEGMQLRIRFGGESYDKVEDPYSYFFKQGYEAGVVAYYQENLLKEYEGEQGE